MECCDFKSGSCQHEVEDENLEAASLIAPGSLGSFYSKTITENLLQSSLVYRHSRAEAIEKFYSPSPFDEKTLEFYVMSNGLTLYIDHFDRRRCFFDLQK